MSLPYSVARKVGDWLYISGQIAKRTDGSVESDIVAQTKQTLENFEAALVAHGYSVSDVVKTTVFLADMEDFGAMNEIYGAFFKEPYPARSTVAVRELPCVADVPLKVEIEGVAFRSAV